MKILYVMFSFTTGGMEKLQVDTCNAMIKRNHEVSLCIINNLYSSEMLNKLDKKLDLIMLNRRPRVIDKIKAIKSILDIVNKKNIEVIHCNGINTPEMVLLSKIIKPNIKIYYTIHDSGQYKNLSFRQIILRNIICKKLIAISKCVEREMIQYGAHKSKVIKIYNGVDIEKYSKRSRNKKFDINNIKICNVARIIPQKKGQDLLIKAIEKLRIDFPNIKCYFLGEDLSDNQNNINELKELVSKLKLENNIIFLGNIEDITKVLSDMDIFVMPSRYEGFGLALVEAMAMKLPCIASKLDGPYEIIGNEDRGLLFESGNYKELYKKLYYMITNFEYFNNMTPMSLEYVLENFDLKKMIDNLEKVYEQR